MIVAFSLETLTVTEPSPGGVNDDFLLAAATWALVLDGVSAPAVDVGCRHSVPWFVARLGTHLATGLATAAEATLADILATAIRHTTADHGPECDLSHPLTPASTVAMARVRSEEVEWLVLGDATVAWQLADGSTDAVTDDRAAQALANAPMAAGGVRRADLAYVAKIRNTPDGFWVAAADPDAARHAFTGALPLDRVARVALYSDGVTRLVERYGRSWGALFDLVDASGPVALVSEVRAAEQADPDPDRWRGKRHDDATAIIARPVLHLSAAGAAGAPSEAWPPAPLRTQ